jgi:hypothetical protein
MTLLINDLQTIVQILRELGDPFMAAIQRLEADKTLLSQVLPVIKSLEERAKSSTDKWPDLSTGFSDKKKVATSIKGIFNVRLRDFLYEPCVLLAFLLDPLNFRMNILEQWVLPVDALSDDEMQHAQNCVKSMSGQEALDELLGLMLTKFPESEFARVSYQKVAARTVEEHKGVEVTRVVCAMVHKNVWGNVIGRQCPALAKVAVRLLSMHATACACERDWSKWGNLYHKYRNALSLKKGEMMVFIAENDQHSDLRPDEDMLIEVLKD